MDDLELDIIEEVKEAIKKMPCDKSSGSDGFTGAFFKKSWNIIKVDIMNAIHLLQDLHGGIFTSSTPLTLCCYPRKRMRKGSPTLDL